MSVDVGTRLGSLEITALLGKGGMGEVYRARDTKLKREVAIKFLPEEFSRDPSRVNRFQREAEVLASLNHPNIAAIYDVQEAGETRFLVLELVEGETLAERIQRGPIPVEEALDIATHMCEALEAAHEKGIVHRDLKPANVKITPEGKVKVLDFGLAKALEVVPAQAASNSPTLLSAAAMSGGVVLGTAGYMSPEQAKGHSADQRSDIFSFGCVLYEMLTGRQTFHAETVTETLAAILMREPDLNALRANLHPKIEELIRRCLAKNRKDRWHAVADVRFEIGAIMADPHGLTLRTMHAAARPPLWKWAIAIAVTALLAVGLTLVTLRRLQPAQSADVMRFLFVLPKDQAFTNPGRHKIAISPDGANIVYVANQKLYLRSLADMEARPIPGMAMEKGPALSPFFSPDGRWVGFFSGGQIGQIKKVAIIGGAAVTLCDAMNPFGATWASDDQIYFGEGPGGIMRVSAQKGGKPERVVSVNPNEAAHGPQLLPGGDVLLFTVARGVGVLQWDTAQIVAQSLKTGERHLILQGGSDARYAPTGHLVYALGSTLLAAPFDLRKLQLTGAASPIVEDVARAQGGATAAAQFAFSSKGSMVYIPGLAGAGNRTVALVDAAGVRKPLDIPPGPHTHPRISPDGKLLALQTDDGISAHIWIYDMTGAASIRQLTFTGRDTFPIWTRDGQRVVFNSDRETDGGLFWARADGSSSEQLLKAEPGTPLRPETWSLDEKILLFSIPAGGLIRTLSPGGAPKTLLEAPALSSNLSPDGRWLAYTAAGDLYVRPFPLTEAKYRFSTRGVHFPQWSPDGRQLFYATNEVAGTSQIMSVDIRTQPSFAFGKPVPLPINGIVSNQERGGFAVMPDGKHFVVLLPASQAEPGKASADQINVTINWFSELQQRVPVK
jgi:eukaryotic-like serine/threonine-protein kinase